MKIDKRKLRHDINSLFFKLETSISLLKNEISPEEKKIVIDILEKVEKKLKTFMTLSLFEKELETFSPTNEDINLGNFLNFEENIPINSDKKLIEKLFEILFVLNKNEQIEEKFESNRLTIKGNFKIEDEIDKYFVQMLKKISQIGNLNLKINKKKVEINW